MSDEYFHNPMTDKPVEKQEPPPMPEDVKCEVCGGEILYQKREGVENMGSLGGALYSRLYWQKIGHEECDAFLEKQRELEEQQKENNKRVSEALHEIKAATRYMYDNWETKTFDTYRAEPENIKALKYMRAWKPESDTFGFFLMGASGTGKTHLMTATFNFIKGNLDTVCRNEKVNPKNLCMWANFSELMEQMRQEMFGDRKNSPTMQKAKTCRYLFLDDVATGAITDHQRNQFYLILEGRKNQGLPTFMTANLTGEEMKSSFHERVLSRIKENCVVFTIQGSDFRTGVMEANKHILEQRITGQDHDV